jgi:hypothetical protein
VFGFWSLTLYNAEHFFHPNALNRYSLGTKNKTLKRNPDGSLTLYTGAKSPGKDKRKQLAAPAAGPLFAVPSRVLGRPTDPRWHMGAPRDHFCARNGNAY